MGNAANKVIDFGKRIGSTVLDVGNRARDFIGKGYDFIRKIPVIGPMAEQLVNKPIPQLKGLTAKQIAEMGSKGLDIGNKFQGGDYSGAIGDVMQFQPPS